MLPGSVLVYYYLTVSRVSAELYKILNKETVMNKLFFLLYNWSTRTQSKNMTLNYIKNIGFWLRFFCYQDNLEVKLFRTKSRQTKLRLGIFTGPMVPVRRDHETQRERKLLYKRFRSGKIVLNDGSLRVFIIMPLTYERHMICVQNNDHVFYLLSFIPYVQPSLKPKNSLGEEKVRLFIDNGFFF